MKELGNFDSHDYLHCIHGNKFSDEPKDGQVPLSINESPPSPQQFCDFILNLSHQRGLYGDKSCSQRARPHQVHLRAAVVKNKAQAGMMNITTIAGIQSLR